jgi:hypothetical protein
VSERDIAEKAAHIAITERLNAKVTGYLPVNCVAHLLQSRSFSRYNIDIQVLFFLREY